MKEIKDYLHLYLGCEFLYKYTGTWTKEEGENNFIKSNIALDYRAMRDAEENRIEIKPILRKLSAMTEEENAESGKITFDAHYTNTPNIEAVAEFTKYLLSKHFDLFNLINEGLAIDKTKIEQP